MRGSSPLVSLFWLAAAGRAVRVGSMKVSWLLAAMLVLLACSKDETPPETIPFETTAAASEEEPRLEDSDDSAPANSAAPAEDDDTAATPSAQPKAATKPRPPSGRTPSGASIASCCAALSAQARTTRDRAQSSRYKQASGTCYGIDKVVKAGRTSRAAALRQVRALAGGNVPGACR